MPEPTRAAGLARLADFTPRMGRAYADSRNTDFGPERRDNVSGLSPWIRHRLVSEQEAVAAALAAHGPQRAEKFIEEVFWRSYWKGWLEQRPGVWDAYRRELSVEQARLATSGGLRRAFEEACGGRTGIACFDAWAAELTETGTLHNHARMWFASIWIFTLRLPWVLGADLFLRQLLDGDAASNTLSWRWVGGLQTRGKAYVARAANIARHTAGRFDPAGELDENPEPLDGPEPPRPQPLRAAAAWPEGRFAWLLHDDDSGEWALPARPVAIGGFSAAEARSPLGCAPAVTAFARGAVADGVARAAARHGLPGEVMAPEAIADWAASAGAEAVATPWAPVGWTSETLAQVEAALAARRIRLHRLRADWDEACWPHATRGFFAFRSEIPEILARVRPGA